MLRIKGNNTPGTLSVAIARATAAFLLFSLGVGCAGRSPGDLTPAAAELRRLVPGLTPQSAACLTSPQPDFEVCCAAHSPDQLFQAWGEISLRYDLTSLESFQRTASSLDPYAGKLLDCLALSHGFTRFGSTKKALLNLPPERALACRRLNARPYQIFIDPSITTAEKIKRLRTLVEEIRIFGEPADPVQAYDRLTILLIETQQTGAAIEACRAGVEESQRIGHVLMACQLLGQLAELYRRTGHLDSALVCYERGSRIAAFHRLGDQAGRLQVFQAAYHKDMGRFALAEDHYREAEAVCRELGGRNGLRYLVALLEFQADLGCWETVARGLRAAPPLLGLGQDGRPDSISENAIGLEVLRARYAFARGRIEEGNLRFEQCESRARKLGRRVPYYARFLRAWSQELLRHGRPRESLAVSRRGLAYCDSLFIPEFVAAHTMLVAEACFEIGDLAGCRAALESFAGQPRSESSPHLQEWITHDALRVRLALAAGDRESAIVGVREGLERLENELIASRPSPAGWLLHARRHELHQVISELVATDSVLAYATETWFREALSSMGGGIRTRRHLQPLQSAALDVEAHLRGREPARSRRLLLEMQAALRRQRAMHVQYALDEGRVVRWTVTPDSFRRETIGTEGELRLVAERAAFLSGSDPGRHDAVPGPEEITLLRRLARELLPAEILGTSGQRPALLFITTTLWLDLVPFEALDLGSARYEPLQANVDVARLRPAEMKASTPTDAPGLIVSDPDMSDAVRRLHPALAPLTAGRLEGKSLHSFLPSALLLEGSAATKRRLMESWERSGFLYIASHVARDGETPYTSFVPLAPSPGEPGLHDDLIELADILQGRFDGCGLVVLSGCASGRPYIGENSEAPSLGEAFLVRGADAVVETVWPIRDDLAAGLMLDFIQHWAGKGESPVVALNAARRAALSGPAGIRHPFAWAGYRIAVRQVD